MMVVGPVNRSVAPLKMQILLKAPISDVGSGSNPEMLATSTYFPLFIQ
jgi:hypothetical protein